MLLIPSLPGLLPIPSQVMMAVVYLLLLKTIMSNLCRRGRPRRRFAEVGSSGLAAPVEHGKCLLFPDTGFLVGVLWPHHQDGRLLFRSVCT